MADEHWARVKEVCLAALDRTEEDRSHFLAEACGSNEGLRREVESLLAQGKEAEEFLESPALEMGIQLLSERRSDLTDASPAADPWIGKTVSHYQVLEELGTGGMGAVYKATDLDLGRLVALKFLSPPALGASAGNPLDPEFVARIEREARAASALDHPNICTVYEVNQHDGHPFIAMQFVAGKTLKHEINGAPLASERILDLGIQIADALEAAHAAGIIHRDVTSSNIVLTQRGDAKILDFGLAKVRPANAGTTHNSATTTAEQPQASLQRSEQSSGWGTASYMSPEQVLGEPLDVRTDLFSFGVVLYEMATGELPFKGRTSKDVLANVLHQAPVSASALNPSLGGDLDRIISKAIRVEREARYQSAAEMRRDLEKAREAFQSSSRPGSSKMRIAALVLSLMVLATGITYLVQRRRTPRLTARDTLVLADINNATGDPVFDEALKQGVRVQLEQSPFLNVLSDQKVAQQLRYMGRPRDARLSPELAKDVCVRTASAAVLTGSISTFGGHYILGLNAVNCHNGDSLASLQGEAASRESVLQSLNTITTKMRAKLGESLATIQKYDAPIEQATTASLDALRAYGEGLKTRVNQGDPAAIPFFERASELDPGFAMAYARAATGYFNLDQSDKAEPAMKKAFDLHDRVSERERLFIDSHYYITTTGELDKAVSTLQLWQEAYPRDSTAYLDLGVMYASLGQWQKDLEQDLTALQLDPGSAVIYANLSTAYRKLGRLKESEDTLRQARDRKLGGAIYLPGLFDLAFLRSDGEEMQRQVTAASGQPRFEALLLAMQADAEAYHGRLSKANDLTRRSVEAAAHHNEAQAAADFTVVKALREAQFGNLADARTDLQKAISMLPQEEHSELVAFILALSGEPDRAVSIANSLKQEHPLDTILNNYWLPTIHAAVELNHGNGARAIELLQPGEPYEMALLQYPTTGSFFPAYLRGLAFLETGDGKAAASEFQKMLDHRSITESNPIGALAFLGLARAYAADKTSRTTAQTRSAYQAFFEIWKDADPTIPIFKQAKAEYARLK